VNRARTETDAQVAGDVLVSVVGAVIVIEPQGYEPGEQRVEAVIRVAGRGDPGNRVILVHQDVLRAVAVEVDARADELAALCALVVHRLPLGVKGRRGAESACGECKPHADL
jgi:hypothetical protein